MRTHYFHHLTTTWPILRTSLILSMLEHKMSLPESDRRRLMQHPLRIKATPATVQHVLPYIEGKSEQHTMACGGS